MTATPSPSASTLMDRLLAMAEVRVRELNREDTATRCDVPNCREAVSWHIANGRVQVCNYHVSNWQSKITADL